MKKLLTPKRINPGNKVFVEEEAEVENFDFNIFKFTKQARPDKDNIVIISCFSEFGCEVVGALYCIPMLRKRYPDKYLIVAGWYGREYLYRHLVDEFWEVKEEFMWLRDYARAFHFESKNLRQLERNLMEQCSKLVTADEMGRLVVGATCNTCGSFWGNIELVTKCHHCRSNRITQSIFADVKNYKQQVVKIPDPCQEKMEKAVRFLGKNPIGIFARNRKCYGRNLKPEFYTQVILYLESLGYTPIWLGEKQSTFPCPVKHIFDFSRTEDARDLELTLAIVKQLKFTIQFWTASSRLSAIMGTPFILFESPDQIWGNGQEGYRLNLTTFGPRKIVVSHYLNVCEKPDSAVELLGRAIYEMKHENFEEIFGLLESEAIARDMRRDNAARIGT